MYKFVGLKILNSDKFSIAFIENPGSSNLEGSDKRKFVKKEDFFLKK